MNIKMFKLSSKIATASKIWSQKCQLFLIMETLYLFEFFVVVVIEKLNK